MQVLIVGSRRHKDKLRAAAEALTQELAVPFNVVQAADREPFDMAAPLWFDDCFVTRRHVMTVLPALLQRPAPLIVTTTRRQVFSLLLPGDPSPAPKFSRVIEVR